MLPALACLVFAVLVGLTLAIEPKGGLRTFLKLLFGFAYSGDGSTPPTTLQKIRRGVVTAALVGAAGFCVATIR